MVTSDIRAVPGHELKSEGDDGAHTPRAGPNASPGPRLGFPIGLVPMR